MNVSQYPVTTPFGQVAGYPLNNGFHNGIDYGCPMATPVVVNGVTIGLSNNTGASTGPHLHVGKFVNGAAVDPGAGNGFSFASAVVYDTGSDAINGNFVRVTGDGALWNYLHLQNALVTKGQKLEGGPFTMPRNLLIRLFNELLGRDPDNEAFNSFLGKPVDLVVDAIVTSPEYIARKQTLLAASAKLEAIKQTLNS